MVISFLVSTALTDKKARVPPGDVSGRSRVLSSAVLAAQKVGAMTKKRKPSGRSGGPRPGPPQTTTRTPPPRPKPTAAARRGAAPPDGAYWLYGQHALEAALANPQRRKLRLVGLSAALESLRAAHPEIPAETKERAELAALLPPGAVEQGAALLVEPLVPPALPALLARLPAEGRQLVVALDQVTDPQNVGAILRSAAAFGAAAVLTTTRNAAAESGALAKAASGGLELVPYLQEPNLARALDELKAAGFWTLGLAGEAERTLGRSELPERLVLVLGAEGPGLRRLTRERCDFLLRLPTRGALRHLNVSNAAAVALYALLGACAGAEG
jgi:23S rRNA (guanosine2251-2'-O)-methyltransferase